MPALAIGRLDVRVEDVRLHRRDGEADAAELLVRQAGGDLLPGLAAVGAAMDRALGSAVDERAHVAAPLVCGGDDDVRVARIDARRR